MLGRRVMDNPAFLSCVDGLLARVQEEQGREGGGEEGDGDNGGDGDGGRQGGVGSVCHASPSAASSLPPLTLRRVLYDYASYVDAYEEWCAKHSCRREDVFAGNPNPNWLIM